MGDGVCCNFVEAEDVEIGETVEDSSCFPALDGGERGESQCSSHAEADYTYAFAVVLL